MSYDPFADEAQTEVPAQSGGGSASGVWDEAPANNARPVDAQNGNKVSITFKGGTGYEAPWVVVYGVNVADALAQITGDNASVAAELLKKAAQVAKFFQGQYGGAAKSSGGQQRQAGKPAGADEAPNGEKKFCEHGQMQFKSGVSKQGKAYKGFFCQERDKDAQCTPEWIK